MSSLPSRPRRMSTLRGSRSFLETTVIEKESGLHKPPLPMIEVEELIQEAHNMLKDALDFQRSPHFIPDFFEAETAAKRCAREYTKADQDLVGPEKRKINQSIGSQLRALEEDLDKVRVALSHIGINIPFDTSEAAGLDEGDDDDLPERVERAATLLGAMPMDTWDIHLNALAIPDGERQRVYKTVEDAAMSKFHLLAESKREKP